MTAMGSRRHRRHSTGSIAASLHAPEDQFESGRSYHDGPYASTASDSLSSISLLHGNQSRPSNTTYDYDYNRCDERTPLNPNADPTRPKKRLPHWKCNMAFVAINLLLCLCSFYTGHNSGVAPGLTLDDMEKLRRNWILEFMEHEERKIWVGERMLWRQDRLGQGKELEELERQKEQERNDWQVVRKAWDQERFEHDEELRKEREKVERERKQDYDAREAMRMAWECERLEHERQREQLRKEREELERQRNEEREAWELLRKEWERERLEHKRQRERLRKEREKLERQRNEEREAWKLLREEWERERSEHDKESRRERDEKEREEKHRCEGWTDILCRVWDAAERRGKRWQR